MIFAFILLLATIMAAFGIYGYQRGTLTMLISLAILWIAVFLVETRPEQLLTYLNGLYIGAMLVFKSGLNDLASGNLDSAAAKLESIDKPFAGPTADLGLLLIILGAVLLGFLVSFFLKKKRKPGIAGALLGLAYGYLLSAGILPLLGFPAGFLPIPLIRPFDPTMPVPSTAPSDGGLGSGNLLATLSQPEVVSMIALVITIGMAIFLLLSVRRSNKSAKRG
jgi:hypothetical protein